MNSRRYPRTMAEAFGPYTTHALQPMREPRQRRLQDLAIYIASAIAIIVLSALPFIQR